MQARSQRVGDETLAGNKVQTIMMERTDMCNSFIYSTLTNRVKLLQCSRNKEEWRRTWYSETNNNNYHYQYMPILIITLLLR